MFRAYSIAAMREPLSKGQNILEKGKQNWGCNTRQFGGGHAVAQLVEALRYKSEGVVGSIPDGVIGVFHWRNPSGHTMALGLTQPLTEMSTSNISWV